MIQLSVTKKENVVFLNKYGCHSKRHPPFFNSLLFKKSYKSDQNNNNEKDHRDPSFYLISKIPQKD